MDSQKVENFLLANGKYFASERLPMVRQMLSSASDEKVTALASLKFQDPIIMLVISFIGGTFGVDRFLLGDVLLGVLKLVTCGGAGIWSLIDLFLVMGRTREKNLELLRNAII